MSLKILYLEDSPQDIEIIRELLIDAGYDLSMDCTEKKSEFTSLLRSHTYDIILSDFKLPRFNAFDALKLSNNICPEVPFICISGVIGEETAVEIIKKGAVDCVLKDRLVRLPSAIERALDEVKKKRSLHIAEDALQENEERMRAIVEGTPYLFFYTQDANANTTYVSPTVEQITGYKTDIWKKRKDWFITAAEFNQIAKEKTQAHLRGEFTKEPVLIEVCHANGNRILLEAYEYPIMQEGKVVGLQGVAHDITKRKKAEEALKISEQHNKIIAEMTTDYVFIVDVDYRHNLKLSWTSKNLVHVTGRTISEAATYDLWKQIIYSEDIGYFFKFIDQILTTTKSGEMECRSITKFGTARWIHIFAKPETDENNRIITIIGAIKDITERKQMEMALRDSEEKFRAIFESTSTPFAILDRDTTITMVNKAFCKMSGYEEKEVVGMSWTKLLPREELKRLKEYNRKRLIDPKSAPQQYEFLYCRKDGTIRHVLNSLAVIPTNQKIICSFTNITELKQVEEALAEEKRRLSYILEGTNVGTWEWNIQTGERIYNERWAEIIGYTLEELAPISADTRDKFTHPDDVRKSRELVEKHFNKELEYYECETRMRHKNGSWVWVLDRGKVATWTNDGKPLTMSGTHQDITKRKRAEEKANQLAAIVQSSEEAIVGKDLNGIITSWNKGAEKIYGYTEREVIGRSISLLIPTKNKDELQMIFARIKSGENIENFETIRRKKDGQEIQMLLTMSSVLDTEGKIIGVSTVGLDITERKLAEQALWKTTIEREKLIKELQFALDNVKTLQGLIPICASCKKIRDDKGFWNQVEGYISQHTDAKFTHGICPDCAKELYGDVYDTVNEDQ